MPSSVSAESFTQVHLIDIFSMHAGTKTSHSRASCNWQGLAKCDCVIGLNDLTGELTSQFKQQLDI